MKNFDLSVELFREVLNFKRENLQPTDPDIEISINKLAEVYSNLNQLKEAEVLFREALNFRKANLLPNHPSIGDSMNNLAGVL